MLDKVVIIGRPNVGKSTLFNRVHGRRKALVYHAPGTTRDRNETVITWKDRRFVIVDTAGWAEDTSIFSAGVRRQLETALEESSLVLFVVDGKHGFHPLDAEVNNILRRTSKKVLLVVNKIDTQNEEDRVADFYRLGVEDMISLSANQGRNTFALFDWIYDNLRFSVQDESESHGPQAIRLILVGKPNVGKSSLTNNLSRTERSIVHNAPGTTREAVDIHLTHNDRDFILIDTPGLHRRRKFSNDLEYLASLSTHHALEDADVAVLVMDAEQGVGETEARIAELILRNRRACIMAINKWDLIEEREQAARLVKADIEDKLQFLKWSKFLLISAKTGLRTERVLDEVAAVYEEYGKIVPEDELRETVRSAETRKPLSRKGKVLRIKSVAQVGTKPPQFLFTVNDPELVHFSYRRYLENALRARFGFTGTPLVLRFQRPRKKRKD